MADTPITSPSMTRSPVSDTLTNLVPRVFVPFAHADADQVRPMVEAMRASGMKVMAVSEADPMLWGVEIKSFVESVFPERYPVAVVFLSKTFEDSPFCHLELEALVRQAGPDMQQGLIVPTRLDDTPPPVSINRLASLDFRAFQPDEFASQIRRVATGWQDARDAEATELTDEQILARYRLTRNPQILQELWFRIYPKITDLIRSRWGKEVDPSDVAGRTFAVLWPRLRDQLPAGLSFDDYAASTANRIAADLIRERKKDQTKPLETDDLNRTDTAQPVSDPVVEVVRQEQLANVRTAIAHLPAKDRKVVELYFNNCLTMRQIASQLGLPYATVYRLIQRALAKLREQLSDIKLD